MSESDAHIQDADILKMSTQQQHESKPLIRFACTLPSGRELHSEWLDPGKRREAVQAWLGAVRAEIVADEEENRLKARRKALEERAAKETAPPSTTVPSAVHPNGPVMAQQPPLNTAAALASSSAPSARSSDPSLFVRQAVTQAEQNVAYWRAEAAKATAAWQEAESQLKKWRAIALSVGVPTVAEENSPDRAARAQSVSERATAEPPTNTGDIGAVSDTSPVCQV